MKNFFKIVISFLTCTVLLSGCVYEPIVSRDAYLTAFPQYSEAKNKIPELPNGYMRLYVYRPQAFVGMLDNPVITINGNSMGNPKNPYENRFLPGTVFVVDTPEDIARVSWYWDSMSDSMKQSIKILTLSSTEARTWYARWHIPPLNFPGERFLEVINQQTAIKELESLRFTSYVRLERP